MPRPKRIITICQLQKMLFIDMYNKINSYTRQRLIQYVSMFPNSPLISMNKYNAS